MSAPLAKKRALVKVLLTLAAVYSVQVAVTRDSADSAVIGAYRRVSLKAHPDKGGSLEHCQLLNNAKSAWDEARRGKGKGGRPRKQGGTQGGDGAGGGAAGPRAAMPSLKGGGSRAREMVSLWGGGGWVGNGEEEEVGGRGGHGRGGSPFPWRRKGSG